jgi:hypothetical protein
MIDLIEMNVLKGMIDSIGTKDSIEMLEMREITNKTQETNN